MPLALVFHIGNALALYAVCNDYGGLIGAGACCLECFFLASVLAVGEVLGELVPLAADAQSPPLERGGLVGVAGNITLGHIVVAGGLVPDAHILPHHTPSDNLIY